MDEERDGHRVQPEQGGKALPEQLPGLGGCPDPILVMPTGKTPGGLQFRIEHFCIDRHTYTWLRTLSVSLCSLLMRRSYA